MIIKILLQIFAENLKYYFRFSAFFLLIYHKITNFATDTL